MKKQLHELEHAFGFICLVGFFCFTVFCAWVGFWDLAGKVLPK